MSNQDRPILQVGDFVTAKFEDQRVMLSVRERIGNYAVLSNGIRFHVLDDRRKRNERYGWYHESTRTTIDLIQ